MKILVNKKGYWVSAYFNDTFDNVQVKFYSKLNPYFRYTFQQHYNIRDKTYGIFLGSKNY